MIVFLAYCLDGAVLDDVVESLEHLVEHAAAAVAARLGLRTPPLPQHDHPRDLSVGVGPYPE